VHDGEAHFNARREAREALVLAQEAIRKLIALGGYDQERLLEAFGCVVGAHNVVAGMLPKGAMPEVAALLADQEKPHYPTWQDAEPDALARAAPHADKYALAEADSKGRSPDAFDSDSWNARKTDGRYVFVEGLGWLWSTGK
jgi:hypothetical protein